MYSDASFEFTGGDIGQIEIRCHLDSGECLTHKDKYIAKFSTADIEPITRAYEIKQNARYFLVSTMEKARAVEDRFKAKYQNVPVSSPIPNQKKGAVLRKMLEDKFGLPRRPIEILPEDLLLEKR